MKIRHVACAAQWRGNLSCPNWIEGQLDMEGDFAQNTSFAKIFHLVSNINFTFWYIEHEPLKNLRHIFKHSRRNSVCTYTSTFVCSRAMHACMQGRAWRFRWIHIIEMPCWKRSLSVWSKLSGKKNLTENGANSSVRVIFLQKAPTLRRFEYCAQYWARVCIFGAFPLLIRGLAAQRSVKFLAPSISWTHSDKYTQVLVHTSNYQTRLTCHLRHWTWM